MGKIPRILWILSLTALFTGCVGRRIGTTPTTPASPAPAFTYTHTATFTHTPIAPTPTYSFTPLPPAATDTFTPVPPTATDTFTPVPPTPTYTATTVTSGCPSSFTCGPNGSGLIAAAGYSAGIPGGESTSCMSLGGIVGDIFTNTLDASTDPEDTYTISTGMGQSVCVVLDSFDDGSGTNSFDLSAYHCLGTGRTGTKTTYCSGGVIHMTTSVMAFDSNVTIRVQAFSGTGPYRLIVLPN